MPDWSYRTVFRPALFRMPAAVARDFSLGFMGTLSRLPLGPHMIGFLGHMRPDPSLANSFAGLRFRTRVGLGVGLDGNSLALPALSRFGFGFLELGPVSLDPRDTDLAIERVHDDEAIRYYDGGANLGLDRLRSRIAETAKFDIPVMVRVTADENASANSATEQCVEVIEQIGSAPVAFSLMTLDAAITGQWTEAEWQNHIESIAVAAREKDARLMLCLPADTSDEELQQFVAPITSAIDGIVVEGGIRDGKSGRLMGGPARGPALELVGRIREQFDDDLFLISSGGIHDPEHALDLLERGANLVQVDTGLVYSGPGLPKRINEATRFVIQETQPRDNTELDQPSNQTWFWTLLMGLGMFFGGILAILIATTLVVLPYDESFVGMTRDQLIEVNARLVKFMAHDRVTLAGTMISAGLLYSIMSWYGIRRGLHWPKVALLTSAFAGFFSFFLFLGFGYFDPFHAFVTAILFQFLLLALHSRLPPRIDPLGPDLREDRRWRVSQWGQLIYIIHGAVLITAGTIISFVGITHVFVPEDLDFMQTTAEELVSANPRILPLVAHDRATFGGMLISVGVAVLLPSLWGFRIGAKWLYWALLLGGLAGYLPTIVIHITVGYTHFGHLAPAFGGTAMLVFGSILSRPYLCHDSQDHRDDWQRHIEAGAKWTT